MAIPSDIADVTVTNRRVDGSASEDLTMKPLTCQAAVHAASDQLARVLSDAEPGALADHLAGCDSCSCLMDQLHTTIAVLGSRPEVQVPDSLRVLVTHKGRGRGEALTASCLPSTPSRTRSTPTPRTTWSRKRSPRHSPTPIPRQPARVSPRP